MLPLLQPTWPDTAAGAAAFFELTTQWQWDWRRMIYLKELTRRVQIKEDNTPQCEV